MNHSQARSSVNNVMQFCFVLIFIFVSSCSRKVQIISITDQPVFSEKDSFVTSFGNTVFNRNDYFLVKGNLADKEKLKKMINEFVDKYPDEKKKHYNNYLMFFYKNSNNVNDVAIKKEEEKYRHKIFTSNKENDYIGCITYRDSTKQFESWNSKYQ